MSLRRDINSCLTDTYRCPEQYARLAVRGGIVRGAGYFSFGEDVTCFGSCYGCVPEPGVCGALPDASGKSWMDAEGVCLPFDPMEAVDNLRHEAYTQEWRSGKTSLAAKLYYLVRPLLPVGVRKHLQKHHLRNWDKIAFPHWPVDTSVDDLLERLLLECVRCSGEKRIPLIWFWPEGKSSCALMTHDVEEAAGRDFCAKLMEIDDRYGIKGSYQVVPEERYTVTPEFLESVRAGGCEVLVHDLNHDGHLYKNREQFEERAVKINRYLKEYGAEGFRAGVLYRKQLWYDALECAYDMSVPNVAHLDPQRGGCCTVMPYFIGDILEIPVTTVQDYTLFHILNDYSTRIWRQQTEILLAKHGVMSFIVHPDYVTEQREQAVYEELLGHLAELRREKNVWITTPGEVNRWWRQRAAMRLVEEDGEWRIVGAGSERARLAWATEEAGKLKVSLESLEGERRRKLVSESASQLVSEPASQRVSGSASRQVGESASRRVSELAGGLSADAGVKEFA